MGRWPGPLAGLVREVLGAAWRDGAVHAGNLAYLALVTLFPATILVTAVAGLLGRSDAGQEAIAGFLALLPPSVAGVLRPLVAEVVEGRPAGALGLSALVALWTVSGFLETLRSLVRKAHGAEDDRPFWQTRLLMAAAGLAAAASVLLSVAIAVLLALARTLLGLLHLAPLVSGLARLVPFGVGFLALWTLLAGLAPRSAPGPHWPGALLVLLIWAVALALADPLVALAGGLARTYGALAGIMLALLFFYILGFALVLGAETNGALSRRRRARLEAGSTKGTSAWH